MPTTEEVREMLKAQFARKMYEGKSEEFNALTDDQRIQFLEGYDKIIDETDPKALINPIKFGTRRKFKQKLEELRRRVYGH